MFGLPAAEASEVRTVSRRARRKRMVRMFAGKERGVEHVALPVSRWAPCCQRERELQPRRKSAVEIIGQIKNLPAAERAQVASAIVDNSARSGMVGRDEG